jgi:hypothetical protein
VAKKTVEVELLPLPYGVTRQSLEAVDADVLRKAMFKGIYLTELLLFAQAENEAIRVTSTRVVMDQLSKSLFNPERMDKDWTDGGYDLETKIELLKVAKDMHKDGLKFLGDLHRSVASGLEAVKSIERHGSDGAPADKPSKKKATKEVRRLLEDEMAKRVREIEAKKSAS